MAKRIEITWRVDDGYAGPDRPQKTRIRPENFDLEMSDDEMVEIISDAAKNDFDERVSMMIKVDDIVDVIAQVRSSLKAKKD